MGIGLFVFVEGGAPPDAARVLVVLPVVVVVVAAFARVGDFFFGIKHGEDVRFHLFESGVLGECFFGGGVLFAYPLQGAFAVDIFEPEVRVLRGCHEGVRLEEGEEEDFFHADRW